MTIEKKFIKNRAFKNLMAHVCAHSLTVLPGIIPVISIGAAFYYKEQLGNWIGIPLIAFGCITMFQQLRVLREKFLNENENLNVPFQVNTWKNNHVIKEIKIKEKEVKKMVKAIRNLSIENSHFTPQNYEQIASALIDREFYKITLRSWIESQGSVARSSSQMLEDKYLKNCDMKT